MTRILGIIGIAVLVLHGLIHLMGAVAYMRLGDVAGLPYKTTLLGGRWDVGPGGMAAFGALWGVAAVGFVAAAAALAFGAPWARGLLLTVALASLVLTGLDWTVAYAGVAINVAIVLAVLLLPIGVRP